MVNQSSHIVSAQIFRTYQLFKSFDGGNVDIVGALPCRRVRIVISSNQFFQFTD